MYQLVMPQISTIGHFKGYNNKTKLIFHFVGYVHVMTLASSSFFFLQAVYDFSSFVLAYVSADTDAYEKQKIDYG